MMFLFSSFKLFTHLYSLAGVLIAHVSLLLFLLFINRFVVAAEKQQTYPIFSYFNELSNSYYTTSYPHGKQMTFTSCQWMSFWIHFKIMPLLNEHIIFKAT